MEKFKSEVQATIDASSRALLYLKRAYSSLDAGWWASLSDMFTKSPLLSYRKHSILSETDKELARANKAVEELKLRLERLSQYSNVTVYNVELATMWDLFSRSNFLEVMTHMKIGKAKKNVAEAIDKVKTIRQALAEMLNKCQ